MEGSWGRGGFTAPFNLNYSMILWLCEMQKKWVLRFCCGDTKPHSPPVSQPCSKNRAQGWFVLLVVSWLGKSVGYLINCKALLKMRMSSGVWENNKIEVFPSLLVYRIIIVTGKTSWWVECIDSIAACWSADIYTCTINLGTRLTQYSLELYGN